MMEQEFVVNSVVWATLSPPWPRYPSKVIRCPSSMSRQYTVLPFGDKDEIPVKFVEAWGCPAHHQYIQKGAAKMRTDCDRVRFRTAVKQAETLTGIAMPVPTATSIRGVYQDPPAASCTVAADESPSTCASHESEDRGLQGRSRRQHTSQQRAQKRSRARVTAADPHPTADPSNGYQAEDLVVVNFPPFDPISATVVSPTRRTRTVASHAIAAPMGKRKQPASGTDRSGGKIAKRSANSSTAQATDVIPATTPAPGAAAFAASLPTSSQSSFRTRSRRAAANTGDDESQSDSAALKPKPKRKADASKVSSKVLSYPRKLPCVTGKRSLEPIFDEVYKELHTRFAVGEPVEASLEANGKQIDAVILAVHEPPVSPPKSADTSMEQVGTVAVTTMTSQPGELAVDPLLSTGPGAETKMDTGDGESAAGSRGNGSGQKTAGDGSGVPDDGEDSEEEMEASPTYTVKFSDGAETIKCDVDSDDITRLKRAPTRDTIRTFVKGCARRVRWRDSNIWVVKPPM